MAQELSQIKDDLLKNTVKKMAKMQEDKKQTPSLVLPRSLHAFLKTKQYEGLILNLYLYAKAYSITIQKYKHLCQEMSKRANNEVSLLNKQKQQLFGLQKEISYQYAAILLQQRPCKSSYADQFFFETLIYLMSRVLREYFSRDQFNPIEEEVNRLFRTNRYNLIRKRHQSDLILQEYPILKAEKKKPNLATIISQAPEKIAAEHMINKQKNKKKFDYSQLMEANLPKDQMQRSPLLCTWLPSKQSMLSHFNRPKYRSVLKASSNKTIEEKSQNNQHSILRGI